MQHVTLSVVVSHKGKLPTMQQRRNIIHEAGGLTFIGRSHEPTARALSKLPWVERVVATYVCETNAGVWRKGRKS